MKNKKQTQLQRIKIIEKALMILHQRQQVILKETGLIKTKEETKESITKKQKL